MQPAAQLVYSDTTGTFRTRGNDIGHGFGLTQVHLAIEKCPLGKFTGARQAASIIDKLLQDAP